MSKAKVVYYQDPLNDDFADNGIDQTVVDESFPFVNDNLLWRICEAIVYRGIATPLVFLYSKLLFGLKIKNRKVLRKLKGKSYFLIGNHTQKSMDAFTPSLCSFPRKAHIVVNPDAVSIKGLRQIVLMLGGIPLPTELKAYRPFKKAIKKRYEQNRVITIYPEAHIWPYYTGIRPFPPTSFAYPVELNAPCVAFVTTFRRRKLFRNAPPCLTVTMSEPFYPDTALSGKDARQKLRDEVYGFMCEQAAGEDNYEYIKYIQCDERKAPA